MSRKELRVAVSGLGRIGWKVHLPEIAADDRFDLVAVCDLLEERLREAEQTYSTKGFSDYDTMLESARPDLVVIASPTHVHAEQAIAAMQGGVDVFCDKPIAPDLAETDRMIAAMHDAGRKMMVYQPRRALAKTVALKELLARDSIGPVYMIKHSLSGYARRNDWQAWKKFGGGMLTNYGAHAIDLLLYLAGGTVTRVHAALRAVATLGDADDVVKALLETDSGTLLDLDINMATATPLPALIVFGKYGTIWKDTQGGGWVVRYYDPDQVSWPKAEDVLAARNRQYMNTYTRELPWQEDVVPFTDFEPVAFYDKVYKHFGLDEPPFVPIEETREVMRVIEDCRRA